MTTGNHSFGLIVPMLEDRSGNRGPYGGLFLDHTTSIDGSEIPDGVSDVIIQVKVTLRGISTRNFHTQSARNLLEFGEEKVSLSGSIGTSTSTSISTQVASSGLKVAGVGVPGLGVIPDIASCFHKVYQRVQGLVPGTPDCTEEFKGLLRFGGEPIGKIVSQTARFDEGQGEETTPTIANQTRILFDDPQDRPDMYARFRIPLAGLHSDNKGAVLATCVVTMVVNESETILEEDPLDLDLGVIRYHTITSVSNG